MKLAHLIMGTATAAGLGMALSAVAADEDAHPCKADEAKLCANVQRGGGRIAACMKEHKDELSDACKQNLAQRHGRRQGRAASGALSAASDGDADQ